MKKRALLCAFVLAAAFMGCQQAPSGSSAPSQAAAAANQEQESLQWDRIPMVMVDGTLYYDTGEESAQAAHCGMADGEITSSVDGSEIPTEDGQSNFGTGFPYQYGADGTIEIQMNGKWFIFEQRTGSNNQIQFGSRLVEADGLSEETLEWLDWYNSLPEEEQLAVSAIPPDLLEPLGLVAAEDAEAPAQ